MHLDYSKFRWLFFNTIILQVDISFLTWHIFLHLLSFTELFRYVIVG